MASSLLAHRAPEVRQASQATAALLKRYLALTKPRITALITFTALVGMLLAAPTIPTWSVLLWGGVGIALCCACAAALNQVFECATDSRMSRTRGRPLPKGQLRVRHALTFAIALGLVGTTILILCVNPLTAILTFATLIAYTPCG